MQGPNDAELQKVSEEFLNKMQALETSKDWKVKEEKPLIIYSMEVENRVIIKAANTINLPF